MHEAFLKFILNFVKFVKNYLVQAFYQEYCINLTLITTKANSAHFDFFIIPLNARKKS